MAAKITELTAATTAATTDLVPIVADPGGTPVTKKITLANLIATAFAALLTGLHAAVVGNANVIGGLPVLHRIDIADGASGNTDVVLTHKTRIIDAWVVLTAAGNAGNTYTVQSAGNAITDAITPGASDTTLARAAQINDANHEIAAAGTLRVAHVRAGGSSAAIVYVLGVRVA